MKCSTELLAYRLMGPPIESACQHLIEERKPQFLAETRRLLNGHLLDGQITEETQSLLEVVLPINDQEHVPEAVMQAHLLCRTQAAVALLLPPLADAELFGDALEEYFVRDAGELRDQAAAARLKEQAGALKAQAGAAQDVPAAVAKLQQAWPLPEALAALRHALQEPPANPLDAADTAEEQQVPAERMQAAGPATQEPPAQRLQAAEPATQEQRQMHAKHLHNVGPVAQDQQDPPAECLPGPGAVASSGQQAQLGRPPTDAQLAYQPSGGDEQLGHEQQQHPELQSAPQQGICGEQQGHAESTLSSSIPDKLQLVCQEQVALVEAQQGLAVAQGSLAESDDMPRAPTGICNSIGSAQVLSAADTVGALLRDLEATSEMAGAEMPDAKMPAAEVLLADVPASSGAHLTGSSGSPQAAAAGGDPVWNASGSIREGSGSQGGAADAHPPDANMSALEQQFAPDEGQAAASGSVTSPPACGHASSRGLALEEGEPGSEEAQAAGDAQGAAEPSPAEQPLPDSQVQAGASPEAKSGWDHQGRAQPTGQAAKQKSSGPVEHDSPGQLPAEGSVHQLQQPLAGDTLQAGSSSQQQAGAGVGSPFLESEGSPSRVVSRLLQSQVQSLAGGPAPAERSVDHTLAGARGTPSAQCVAAEETEPAMTIPDSQEQAAGQGGAEPLVPQQSAAGGPAVPSPTDEVMRPAVPAFLPAVFGGSLAGKQTWAQAKSLSTDPLASPAESIDTSTQPESIQDATQDNCSRKHLPEDAHLDLAAADALAAVQAPVEAAAVWLKALQGHSQLVEQQVSQAALPVKARKLLPQQPKPAADVSPTAAVKSAERLSTDGNAPAENTGDSLAADKAKMLQPAAGSVAFKEQREKQFLSGHGALADTDAPAQPPTAPPAEEGSGEEQPNLAQEQVDPGSRDSTLEDSLAAATLTSTMGQAAETEAQRRPALTLLQPGAAEAGEVMSPLRPAGEPDVENGAELLWQFRVAEAACLGWQQQQPGPLVGHKAAAASGASPAADSLGQQAPASPQAMQSTGGQRLDAVIESRASSPLMGDGNDRQPESAGAPLQACSVSTAAAGHAEQSLPQEGTAAAAVQESLLLGQALAEDARRSASAPAEAQQAAAEGAEQGPRSDDGNAAGPDAVQSPLCGQAIATDNELEAEAAADAQHNLTLVQTAAVLAKHSLSQKQPAAGDAEHIPGRPGSPAVPNIEHANQTAAENAQQGAQARDAALNAHQGLLLGQTAAEDAENGGLSGPSGLSPGSELSARRHQRDIKVRRRLAEQKAQQQRSQPARPLHVMAAAAAQQQHDLLSAKGARPASRAASSAPPLLQSLTARHEQPEVAQGQAGGLEHSLAPPQTAGGWQRHSPSPRPEAPSQAALPVELVPDARAGRPPSSKPSANLDEAEQAGHRSSGAPGNTIGCPSSHGAAAEPPHTGAASSLRGSQGGSVAGSRSSVQVPQHSSPALDGQTRPSAEKLEGAASAAVACASAAHRAGWAAGHSVEQQQHADQHVNICHPAAQAAFGRQRPGTKDAAALPASSVRSKPPSGSSRSRSVQPAKAGPPAKAAAESGLGAQRNRESGSPCAGPPAGAEAITVAADPGDSPAHTKRHACWSVAPQAESCQRMTGRKRSRSQSALDSEGQAESAQMAAGVAAAASALQSGCLQQQQQQQQQQPERVPGCSPAGPAALGKSEAGLAEDQPARQKGRAVGAGKRRAAFGSNPRDSPEAGAAAKRQRVGGSLLVSVMYQCIRQVGTSRQVSPQPSVEMASGLQQPAPLVRAGERPSTRAQAAAAAAGGRGQASGVGVGPRSDHGAAVRPGSGQLQPAAARPAQLQPRPVTADTSRFLAALRPGTGTAWATSHADQEGGPQHTSAAAPAQGLNPQQLLVLQMLQMHSRQAAGTQPAAGTCSAEQEGAARASAAHSTAQPAARTTATPPALHAGLSVPTGNQAVPAGAGTSLPRARHEAAAAQHRQQAPMPAMAPAQPRQQPPRPEAAPAQPRQQPLQGRAPPAQPSTARRITGAAATGGAQGQQCGPADGQGWLPRRAAPARGGTSYEPPEGMKVHWDSLMHPERARQARLAATVAPPGTMTMEQAVRAVVQDPTRKIPLVVPAAFREVNLRARRAAAAAAAAAALQQQQEQAAAAALTSAPPGMPDSSAAAAAQAEPEAMEAGDQEAGWAPALPQAPRHRISPARSESAAEASRRVAPQPPEQGLQPEREPPVPSPHRQDGGDSAGGWQQSCMRPVEAAQAAGLPLRAADSRCHHSTQMGAGQDDQTAQSRHERHTECEWQQGVEGHMLFTQQPQEDSQWPQEPAIQATQPQQDDMADMRAAHSSAPHGASAGTGWAQPQQPAALPGGSQPAASYNGRQERYDLAPGAAARWPGEQPSAQHPSAAPPRHLEAAWARDSQAQFHADRAPWQPPHQQEQASWRRQPAPAAAQQQRWQAEQPHRPVLPPQQAAGLSSGGWTDQGYAAPAQQQPGMAQRWTGPPVVDTRQLPDTRQAAAMCTQAAPPSMGWHSLPHMQRQGWQGLRGAPPPAAAGSGWQAAGSAADPPQLQRWQQQPGIAPPATGSRWHAACPAQGEGYAVDRLHQQTWHGDTLPPAEWANPGLTAGCGHMQPQQPSCSQPMLCSGHADASQAPHPRRQQAGAMQAAAAAHSNRSQAWQQAEASTPPVAAMRQQAAHLGHLQGQEPEGDTGSEASLAGWHSACRLRGAGAGSGQAGANDSGPFTSLLRQLTGRGPGGQAPCLGVTARSAAPGAGPSRLGAPQASWHSEDSLLCRAADQASLDKNAEQNDQPNQHHQGPLNASPHAAAQEADPRQAAPAWPDSRLPAEASLQHTGSPGPALSGQHGCAVYGQAEAQHTGKQRGAERGVLPALEDDEAFDVGACAARKGHASSSVRRQRLLRMKQTADALRVLAQANQQIDAREEQIWGPSRACRQGNGQKTSARPQKRGRGDDAKSLFQVE